MTLGIFVRGPASVELQQVNSSRRGLVRSDTFLKKTEGTPGCGMTDTSDILGHQRQCVENNTGMQPRNLCSVIIIYFAGYLLFFYLSSYESWEGAHC